MLKQETEFNKNEMKHQVLALRKISATLQAQIESSDKAIKHANEASSETIQRQQLGLSRPFEIEQAQAAFIKSSINYLKSVTNYNILQYQLFMELGNNF